MKQQIQYFNKRFPTSNFGEGHLLLACHAAFPIALTTDLLYQIWVNFKVYSVGDELENISYLAVSDVLQSNLCRKVGHDLFEMDTEVRNNLLEMLKKDERFGENRIKELAIFLYQYTDRQLEANIKTDLQEIQRWTALATLQPSTVFDNMAKALSNSLDNGYGNDVLRLNNLLKSYKAQTSQLDNLQALTEGITANLLGEDLDDVQSSISNVLTIKEAKKGITISIPDDMDSIEFEEFDDVEARVLERFEDLFTIDLINQSREITASLKGHLGLITTIEVSPNNKYLASAAMDMTVRVWDLETSEYVSFAFEQVVSKLSFNPSSRLLATGENNGNVSVWDFQQKKRFVEYRFFKNELHDLAFSVDDVLYFSEEALMRWDINQPTPTKVELRPPGKNQRRKIREKVRFAIGRNGQSMAIADDRKLIIKNLETNRETKYDIKNRIEEIVSDFGSEYFAYRDNRDSICVEHFENSLYSGLENKRLEQQKAEIDIARLELFNSQNQLIGIAKDTGQQITWDTTTNEIIDYSEKELRKEAPVQFFITIQKDDIPLNAIVRKRKVLNLSNLNLTGYSTPLDILEVAQNRNFPGVGYAYHHIEKLDLSDNQLTELDLSDNVLSNLLQLNADNNQIAVLDARKLPDTIRDLDLNGNQLSELDFTIRSLSDLMALNLNDNQLHRISEGIVELRSLSFVRLTGNRFMEIPNSFKYLERLLDLNLSDNLIEQVDVGFLMQLPQNAILHLHGNKLPDLGDELLLGKVRDLIKLFEKEETEEFAWIYLDIADNSLEQVSQYQNIEQSNETSFMRYVSAEVNTDLSIIDNFNQLREINEEALTFYIFHVAYGQREIGQKEKVRRYKSILQSARWLQEQEKNAIFLVNQSIFDTVFLNELKQFSSVIFLTYETDYQDELYQTFIISFYDEIFNGNMIGNSFEDIKKRLQVDYKRSMPFSLITTEESQHLLNKQLPPPPDMTTQQVKL